MSTTSSDHSTNKRAETAIMWPKTDPEYVQSHRPRTQPYILKWLVGPVNLTAVTIIGIAAICALAPNWLAPYDPYQSHAIDRLQPPNTTYLLGTDELGRDVLSRIIYGARTSLLVGVIAVLIGTGIGATLGLVSGYFGGIVDVVIQRVIDSFMAFPGLILALAVLSVYGAGIKQETLVIAVLIMPTQVRVVRSAVFSVKGQQHVEAAMAIGATHLRVMLRHVLPNVMAPIIVLASVSLAFAVLIEGALSYLGLGTPPPTPSWGGMIASGGGAYLHANPTLSIFPGVALSLVIIACNLLGDSLRDALDPRLRGQ